MDHNATKYNYISTHLLKIKSFAKLNNKIVDTPTESNCRICHYKKDILITFPN